MIELVQIFDSSRSKHALHSVIRRCQHGVREAENASQQRYGNNQLFLLPQGTNELYEIYLIVRNGGQILRGGYSVHVEFRLGYAARRMPAPSATANLTKCSIEFCGAAILPIGSQKTSEAAVHSVRQSAAVDGTQMVEGVDGGRVSSTHANWSTGKLSISFRVCSKARC